MRRLRDLTRAQRQYLLSLQAASAVYLPRPKPQRRTSARTAAYISTRIAEGILYALVVGGVLALLFTIQQGV